MVSAVAQSRLAAASGELGVPAAAEFKPQDRSVPMNLHCGLTREDWCCSKIRI